MNRVNGRTVLVILHIDFEFYEEFKCPSFVCELFKNNNDKLGIVTLFSISSKAALTFLSSFLSEKDLLIFGTMRSIS